MTFPKLPPKWVVVSLLIVVAFILYRIPKSMEVTLQVRADHIEFKLLGQAPEMTILDSLPLTALHVSIAGSLSLPVHAVYEQDRALVSSAQRITLRPPPGRELRLTWWGEALRLMQLSLASDSQVALSADQQRQLIMQVKNPGATRLQLGVLQAFTLAGHDMTVVDERGAEFLSSSAQQPRALKVTPARRNVDIEWGQTTFALTLDVSGQLGVEADWPLPFAPRLPLYYLNFTRKEGATLVTSIQSLHTEPLMKQDEKASAVYLDLRPDDAFRLRSMHLSGAAITCDLIGRTNQLRYGPGAFRPNRMPSLLQYWIEHEFIKVIKDIWGNAK